MAVLVVNDPKFGTNYSFNSAAAGGQGFTVGYLNFSGVTYAGGGVTMSLPFHTTEYVGITPRLATSTNVFFLYASGLVQLWAVAVTTTAGGVPVEQVASDTALSSFTNIPFVAYGRD